LYIEDTGIYLQVGVSKDGKLLGIDYQIYLSAGWSTAPLSSGQISDYTPQDRLPLIRPISSKTTPFLSGQISDALLNLLNTNKLSTPLIRPLIM
jgi:hypothetical protein